MAEILVVDDEETIRIVLSELFRAHGHDVTTAPDGVTAIDLIKSRPELDLVVTDMRMSPVDGMQVLESSKECREDLPVIVLTAFANEYAMDSSFESGAFAYHAKPFKADSLLQSVSHAIAGPEPIAV